MKVRISAALFTAALLAGSEGIRAHGGAYRGGEYRGPGDTVGRGKPGGPGGGSTSGPTTPGPGGPTRPTSGGPITPRGPGSPRRAGPPGGPLSGPTRGPSTGGPRGIQLADDLSTWDYWWAYNREPYLQLKQRLHQSTVTGSDDFLMGRGLRSEATDLRAVLETDIKGTILPALKAALQDPRVNRDIVSSALIALARIGRDPSIIPLLRLRLRSRDQEIRETASLALGIAALPEAVPDLLALASDEPAGRRLCERAEVDFRTRAFACYGLGLVMYYTPDEELKRRVYEAMRGLFEPAKNSRRDIRVAALHALRLLRPGTGSAGQSLRGAATTFLCGMLEDESISPLVRAHGYTALADLLGHEADPELVAGIASRLKTRRQPAWIHQSAVIALGCMARPADHAVSKVLSDYLREGRNEQSRNFCAIALGQIGGAKNREILLKMLVARRTRTMSKPWLALGLAIMDHAARRLDASREVDATSAEAILREFQRVRNPLVASGLGIALGLLRYRDAGDALLERALEHKNQDDLVGHLCVALGLMGFKEATEDIHAIVDRSSRRAAVLTQATIALGLLGDRDIALKLADRMRDHRQIVAVQSAIASALGFIGDRRSLAPLVAILSDRNEKNIPRAFAAVALGLISDKEALPWNSKIATDINYRASVETLRGGAAGILDLL